MKKSLLIILAIVIIGIGVYVFYTMKHTPAQKVIDAPPGLAPG
jgi:hypothetical protein